MNIKKIAIASVCSLFFCIFTIFIMFGVHNIILKTNESSVSDISNIQYRALLCYNKSLVFDNSMRDEIRNSKTDSISSPEADTMDASKSLSNNSTQDDIYIIKQGDTLSKISAKTSYSVDKIANYNQICNVNHIYTDSSLRIPEK